MLQAICRTNRTYDEGISNVASLHTGVGLANASKQTVEVYNRLK